MTGAPSPSLQTAINPPSLILVTGATGLLGSEIVRQLVGAGERVRILRRERSRLDLLGELAGQVEHALGDVTDPESLGPAMEGVAFVYHTAATLGGGRTDGTRSLYQINVEGTRHMMDAALRAGVRRLVHTSSMAAFGRPEQSGGLVLDEQAEWTPSRMNTSYAESKYLAELEVQRAIAEGLEAVIVNPSLIFGHGRKGENTGQIVQQVRSRRLPAIPPGGTNVVDVRDVAEGHRRAMLRGLTGERYFLGSENLSWEEIIRTLAESFGVAPPRFRVGRGLSLAFGGISEAFGYLTRTSPLVTRERARAAASFYHYSNRRAVEELGCTFRPFAETARDLARR